MRHPVATRLNPSPAGGCSDPTVPAPPAGDPNIHPLRRTQQGLDKLIRMPVVLRLPQRMVRSDNPRRPMNVESSYIHAAVLPCIRKRDQAEFTRMLQLVADTPGADFEPDAEAIGHCFYFDQTPQGPDYWIVLCNKLLEAGFNTGWSC